MDKIKVPLTEQEIEAITDLIGQVIDPENKPHPEYKEQMVNIILRLELELERHRRGLEEVERKQKRTWLGLNAYEEITMWKPEPLNIKAGTGEDWFIKEWNKDMKGDWPGRQDTPSPNQLFIIDWETKDIEELAGY